MSKKIKIAILTILSFFLLYAMVCGAYSTYRFYPLYKEMGMPFTAPAAYMIKDGYSYTIAKSGAFSMTGNLAVCEIGTTSLDKETYFSDMLIWPVGLRGYEISVSFFTTRYDMEEGGFTSHAASGLMLDGNKNLLEDTEENRKIYREHEMEIDELYLRAHEMWGIFDL